MYYCCKACDDACTECCKCIDRTCKCLCDACEGCARAISKVFSKPFSFCVFIAVIIFGGPAVYGLYLTGTIDNSSKTCDDPEKPNPLIYVAVLSVNQFLIIAFLVYLMIRYG